MMENPRKVIEISLGCVYAWVYYNNRLADYKSYDLGSLAWRIKRANKWADNQIKQIKEGNGEK